MLAYLFQTSTPDTTSGLIIGYAIIAVVAVVYLITLAVRRRNLQKDLEQIERLKSSADE